MLLTTTTLCATQINVAHHHTDQLCHTDLHSYFSAVSTVLQGKMLCCAESWQCAAKQCFCGRVGAGANIEACAGGTQRGPSPGPHRTRGGSSIYFPFYQTPHKTKYQKIVAIMKKRTSMKPTLHCLEEKLLLVRAPLEIELRLVPNFSNLFV